MLALHSVLWKLKKINFEKKLQKIAYFFCLMLLVVNEDAQKIKDDCVPDNLLILIRARFLWDSGG